MLNTILGRSLAALVPRTPLYIEGGAVSLGTTPWKTPIDNNPANQQNHGTSESVPGNTARKLRVIPFE